MPKYRKDTKKEKTNGSNYNKRDKGNVSQSSFKKDSNNNYNNEATGYLLPRDTRSVSLIHEDQFYPDNFALMVNKFYTTTKKDDKYKFENRLIQNEPYDFYSKPQGKNIINKIKANTEAICRSFEKQGYKIKSFDKKTISPMVIGLGNEDIFETSLTLHHIYGIPYIPASAIKGVVRNWTVNSVFNAQEGDKKTGALGDPAFCKIFGSPKNSISGERKGRVIFLDAFPSDNNIKVKLDIIATHYHQYYTSGGNIKPPADYLQPNITNFLAVDRDATFFFNIMVKEVNNEEIKLGQSENYRKSILEVAEKLLVEALTIEGIGAKTSVGYGLFA